MSDVAAQAPAPPASTTTAVSIGQIFVQFLIIGATSFGGGAVAYLRASLVTKNKWLDDEQFMELFSISQSLPGLNTTNMAILAGDRMRGWLGALAAVLGIILPGATIMTLAGIVYGMHGDRPLVTAGLKGVAAAATGMLLATFIQLARKTLRGWLDVVFIIIAVILVNRFHVSVLYALLGIATLATLAYRPRSPKAEPPAAQIEPEQAPS
jgi:chromate transporter